MSKELKNLIMIFGAVIVAAGLIYAFLVNTQPKCVTETAAPVAQMPLVGNLAASHSFSTGPGDAKVTVVEFFDPECEACAAVAPIIAKEMKHYEGKVRWVFRYMAFHHNSRNAIKILEALRAQNLFLEAQHHLFETQKIWGEKQASTEADIMNVIADVKGLNFAQLKKQIDEVATDQIIARDAEEGRQAGVQGTPTFFVNGAIIDPLNLDELIRRINEGLK